MLRLRGGELAIGEQSLWGRERSEEVTCREGGRLVRQRRAVKAENLVASVLSSLSKGGAVAQRWERACPNSPS